MGLVAAVLYLRKWVGATELAFLPAPGWVGVGAD